MVAKNRAVLHEAGLLVGLIKEQREPLCRGAGHYAYLKFYQYAVVPGVGIDRCQADARILADHAPQLGKHGLFSGLCLILKHIAPDRGAVSRSSRQLTLLYVEGVGEVSLDQLKVGQSELFAASYGAESHECWHQLFNPRPIMIIQWAEDIPRLLGQAGRDAGARH